MNAHFYETNKWSQFMTLINDINLDLMNKWVTKNLSQEEIDFYLKTKDLDLVKDKIAFILTCES